MFFGCFLSISKQLIFPTAQWQAKSSTFKDLLRLSSQAVVDGIDFGEK